MNEEAGMNEAKIEGFKREAVELSAVMQRRLGAEFFEGDGDAHVGLFDTLLGTIVAFEIDGLCYTLDPLRPGDLLAIRDHGGGTEWARIDANGEPDKWRRQAPSRSQAAQN